ncbi:4726_t:CDS:2 [Paraglomus brasilianum]|uniref:4726_t:CDS:1 n=1 Tax=Paraglomus brasilianum TaxID=144538 RepID=A0A9N8WC30_9GLOM|nr:4726_t:CDS:2 [Paraglomus brasilianum]
MSTSTTTDPSVEDVEGYNTEILIAYLQNQRILNLSEQHINVLRENEVAGYDFLRLKQEDLERYGLKPGPAKRISDFAIQLNSQKQPGANAFCFCVQFCKSRGDFQRWEIEEDTDIKPQRGAGDYVLINTVNLLLKDQMVAGGGQMKDDVFPDIIIGHADFYKELTKIPPDLSKGLGWEVKSDLKDGSKVTEGKGQLVKYARAYLAADPPLTNVFYGCLTDGKFWLFVKIQLVLNNTNNPKVKFEESQTYEWNKKTASLIAGIIECYHNDLSMRASDGIYIRLHSGNHIHVQITSHLGTGRECIVFLAQVRDYGIKDAVLKIGVRNKTCVSLNEYIIQTDKHNIKNFWEWEDETVRVVELPSSAHGNSISTIIGLFGVQFSAVLGTPSGILLADAITSGGGKEADASLQPARKPQVRRNGYGGKV